MIRSPKFWISMTVFQVIFGLAVFSATRQYYIQDQDNNRSSSTALTQPMPGMPGRITDIKLTPFNSPVTSQPVSNDPAVLSRQADEFFDKKEYDKAAEFYQRLLELNPNDVDTYNNLGLTLHYLGRSTEALDKLNEGTGIDPTYQRIWLTLGFVNSQVGNTGKARTALTAAVKLDADNEVGQAAAKMLADLPGE